MPKYMYAISYTTEGIQGLMQDGGSARQAAAEAVADALGATIEGFWFAYGDADAYVVLDAPDGAAAAGSILTGASGAVSVTTIPLITAAEMDDMAAKAREAAASYRPPGD